ncbi:metallophosphoesterase [Anaerobacillus sp. MEB173]|uniref:metallophosphoesterase n=1 Tax=Anaerobacillus sp. MEB173 TaxID=3383345 RepID=UPI003F93D138
MSIRVMIFLFIYFILSFYVAYNGWAWLKKVYGFRYKKTYFLVMFFISISFFLTRMIVVPGLSWVAYGWLVMFAYGLVLFPVMNLIYFLTKKRAIKWLGFGVLSFYLFVFIYGSYNMWNPVVVSYDIEIEKETELDELKVLLISDIHLSETIGNRFLNKLINLSNEVEPDIIFLAGDVIDNSIEPYLKHNMGEILSGLHAPMGVYAVLGNHEYYGGDIPIFMDEMNDINVDVLVDEVTSVEDLFYIVGRKDYSVRDRENIADLTIDLNQDMPVFLIDHQPRQYDEVAAAGVDLMVSGHTHKGQLFPANLITKSMYENHHGHLQKEQLHTIVSSGFGIWGPPFRIGSRSEIVEINVRFVH